MTRKLPAGPKFADPAIEAWMVQAAALLSRGDLAGAVMPLAQVVDACRANNKKAFALPEGSWREASIRGALADHDTALSILQFVTSADSMAFAARTAAPVRA